MKKVLIAMMVLVASISVKTTQAQTVGYGVYNLDVQNETNKARQEAHILTALFGSKEDALKMYRHDLPFITASKILTIEELELSQELGEQFTGNRNDYIVEFSPEGEDLWDDWSDSYLTEYDSPNFDYGDPRKFKYTIEHHIKTWYILTITKKNDHSKIAKIKVTCGNILKRRHHTITITPDTSVAPPVQTGCAITLFVANPNSIDAGSSSTLSWTTTSGCTGVSLTGTSRPLPTTFDYPVSPTVTTTYVLTAYPSGAVASAIVYVNKKQVPPVNPNNCGITEFSATPSVLITKRNEFKTSLTWSSTCDCYLTVRDGNNREILGNLSKDGSRTISPSLTPPTPGQKKWQIIYGIYGCNGASASTSVTIDTRTWFGRNKAIWIPATVVIVVVAALLIKHHYDSLHSNTWVHDSNTSPWPAGSGSNSPNGSPF